MYQVAEEALRKRIYPQAVLAFGDNAHAFALRYAQQIFCEGTGAMPCSCLSCAWVQAMTHPDVTWITPEKPGVAIRVEAIRTLLEMIYIGATRAKGRLVVISPADALNTAAANALLKILEEPPPDVRFLLLSTQPSGLPATIVSRCQRWSLPVAVAQDNVSDVLCQDWIACAKDPRQIPLCAEYWLKQYDLEALLRLLCMTISAVVQIALVATNDKPAEKLLTLSKQFSPQSWLDCLDAVFALEKLRRQKIPFQAQLAVEHLLIQQQGKP